MYIRKYFSYILIPIFVCAVCVSGCIGNPFDGILNSDSDGYDHNHDHDHDDHNHDHDHDHGDDSANYVPLNSSDMDSINRGEKILAAVSMIPQAAFVEKVGGDKVIALAMVPPGAGHTYDPSPRQLQDLAHAKIYFALNAGEPFEKKHVPVFSEANPNLKFVNTSDGIHLIKSGRSTDPHIWTSPKEAQIMVENIYLGLKSIDPKNESYYFKNKESYIQELRALDMYIEDALRYKKNRVFIVYHPAWSYYANDYNLKQIAIELDGKEPSAKSIKNLVDEAKKENVKVVFVQKQVSQTASKTIADEIGGFVVSVDPLSKDYIENTKYMTDILKEHMS